MEQRIDDGKCPKVKPRRNGATLFGKTLETVLATHHATLDPGFVVLPAQSGALLK